MQQSAAARSPAYPGTAGPALILISAERFPAATPGTNLLAHLKHHGINASLKELQSRSGDIVSTLMDAAKQFSADLLVMGGYGRSRMREWLLGGVTYRFLRQGSSPLLIAH